MSKTRIEGFDGIRGIAATAVIVHHALVGWRNLGEVSVDLFFALSGFLIFGILKTARTRIDHGHSTISVELTHFWTNRALRIFPIYYCVLVFMVSAGLILHIFPELLGNVAWYAVYLQNFQIAFFAKGWGSFTQTWTLAVEQQFYILFGLVLLLVPVRRYGISIGISLAIALAGTLWAHHLPAPARLILPFRGFIPILAGGTAAVFNRDLSNRIHLSLIGANVASISCAVVIMGCAWMAAAGSDGTWHHVPYMDFVPIMAVAFFGAILLWTMANHQEVAIVKFLKQPTLRWLGTLSYGIYVVHLPVIDFLGRYGPHFSPIRFFAMVLVLSIAAAQVLHWCIEIPAAQFRHRMPKRGWAST